MGMEQLIADKEKHMIRQGDVLLIPVRANLQGTEIPAEEGRIILARGEATGHHHSLRADVAKLYDREQKRYLRVTADTTLDHQEHAPILIKRGTYLVVRQREYSPEALRNVQD